MSLDATRWAWDVPVENAGQRLVLLNLADRANKEGQCWPSQKRIARDTKLSERSVRGRLGELETMRVIKRQHRKRGTGRTSDLIWLLMEGKPNAPIVKSVAPPPANDAATRRQDLPECTGTSCRQTDQDLTDQIETNTSTGFPGWLRRIPEYGHTQNDRYNLAVAFAEDVAPSIAAADWNKSGLKGLDLVEDWLDRFEIRVLRDCLIETAARAARAGTKIRSWHYFTKAIDKLSKKNGRR